MFETKSGMGEMMGPEAGGIVATTPRFATSARRGGSLPAAF